MMLNPIIKGWGNYYKYGTSANVFHRMDWEIFKKIWQWARRRHPQKCKGWVKDKYFRTLMGTRGDLRQIWARKIRLIISN